MMDFYGKTIYPINVNMIYDIYRALNSMKHLKTIRKGEKSTYYRFFVYVCVCLTRTSFDSSDALNQMVIIMSNATALNGLHSIEGSSAKLIRATFRVL